MGRKYTKEERFKLSKCDRCGKATPSKTGEFDLFVLDYEMGKPMADQGAFCLPCLKRYDRSNWIEWFKEHRPEIFYSMHKIVNRMPNMLVTEHPEYGTQVWCCGRITYKHSSDACRICSSAVGSEGYRPVTNLSNRMYRICKGCGDGTRCPDVESFR